MKKIFQPLATALVVTLLLTACKKDIQEAQPKEQESDAISQEVLGKIKNLGFGTSSVQKTEGGYLVEGDILLTDEHLNSKPETKFLRVGDEEQYRTINLVKALPRTIRVRVSTLLPNYWTYVWATNAAIARYNALGLRIKFVRVTTGGDIVIIKAPAGVGYLASAGFPSFFGNPYSAVRVNTTILNGWNFNTVTSILAHEIGHCVGMRHTDFMNRSFSCGGAPVNEGAAGVGAIHIPGTPFSPEAKSWMLACISNGVNRPFTLNDKIALNNLY